MNILDKIVESKRMEIDMSKTMRPFSSLKKKAKDFKPQRRPFKELFQNKEAGVLIAEIKPQSPSAGELIKDSPLAVADLYAKSKADVISVLTDAPFFGGTLKLMRDVRAHVPQAILRKDFIIDEYQVYETFLAEADAFLLIANLLTAEELAHLVKLGASFGLGTLVEVHDAKDMQKVFHAGADVIGINHRDLDTLEVDISVTEKLIRHVPEGTPVVSESGIDTAGDVRKMRKLGARGILVGTSILQSPDPLAKIKELKEALHI